jgi:hypothetical protein
MLWKALFPLFHVLQEWTTIGNDLGYMDLMIFITFREPIETICYLYRSIAEIWNLNKSPTK